VCWKSSKGDVYLSGAKGAHDFGKPNFAFTEAKSFRIRGLSPALSPCHELLRLCGNPTTPRGWKHETCL